MTDLLAVVLGDDGLFSLEENIKALRTTHEPGVNAARSAPGSVPALVAGLPQALQMDDATILTYGAAARTPQADLDATLEQFAASWRRIYDGTARPPTCATP